jgi:hypothetical protein
MSFFYDLNKKLDSIRATPEVTHQQLNERDMSRAAKGYEKYGKEGMEKLAQAGRDGKALDPIRKKYDKYDNTEVDEGVMDTVKSVGKKVASGINKLVGHGSDEDMIRDLQRKSGAPVTGKKPVPPQQVKEKLSPAKQKSFAALAPPADKITFADKIAGAKKEVDEMLGDVAAEAMKAALGKGKQPVRGMGEATKEIPGGRRHTAEPGGYGRRDDDEAPKVQTQRGRGRPKKHADSETGEVMKPDFSAFGVTGKDIKLPKHKGAVTKHKMVGEGDDAEVDAAIKMLKKAGYTVSKDEEPVNEKAVSKKQQKFMGMVHAAQKGEKPASKEVAKVAKEMPEKEAKKFAKTKHKGLPEKVKEQDTEEKVEETTVSGSVATAPAEGGKKSKGGINFGGSIYDSMNRDLENMISESMARLDESMSINMSMNSEADDGQGKSLTVTATGDDADRLATMLKMAGLGSNHSESYAQAPDMVDENKPDWPTNTETSDDALQYSGGLNKPKTDVAGDGQTTIPNTAVHTQDEDALRRMMEMAGMRQNDRLDEGIMDMLAPYVKKAANALMSKLDPQTLQGLKQAYDQSGGDRNKFMAAIGITKQDLAPLAKDLQPMKEGVHDDSFAKVAFGSGTSLKSKVLTGIFNIVPTLGMTDLLTGGNIGSALTAATGGSVLQAIFYLVSAALIWGVGSYDFGDMDKEPTSLGEDDLDRMMEMAGMSQNNRLDEGMMDKIKGMLVPKLMKLLGPDADNIANAVRQATGGDLTPSKENAMKVVQALGIDKAATQGQSQMAEGIAGNWQGKLIQALYTLGLLGSAAVTNWASGPGRGTDLGIASGLITMIGVVLLMFAATFFSSNRGMVGAMGRHGNKGFDTNKGPNSLGEDDLDRMMEMAGVKKKEVDEEKTEEGNKFTGNLAKARAAGKKQADLDGDGKMEKVDESIFAMTANLWKSYKD